MMTHDRLMIPRRSVPSPRLSTGKHTTATITGKQFPKRFHRVLPASERPLGTTVSNDATSGSRFSDGKDISWELIFILCLSLRYGSERAGCCLFPEDSIFAISNSSRTISVTSSSNVVRGVQPSFSLAFAAFPKRFSTSAGRK